MKQLIILIFFFSSIYSFTQDKYLTKTGNVSFEASVPSFEEVKAKSNSVTAIINTNNGEFAALVLVKGFRFKNALMEEHFNENYAESDKFPKATFKGKIENFDLLNLKNDKRYMIHGSLTFHGKSKQFKNLLVSISKENNIIKMTGAFKAKASDFDIKIPKIVRSKIAEEIKVSFVFELNEK